MEQGAARLFCKNVVRAICHSNSELARNGGGFASVASVDSRYKRIQRFFRLFKLDYVVIARWLFKLFFAHSDKVYITIDRTNWCWGKTKINVLMLAIAYEGLAIPIYIRIKEGARVFIHQKKYCKAKKLFNDLNSNTVKPQNAIAIYLHRWEKDLNIIFSLWPGFYTSHYFIGRP